MECQRSGINPIDFQELGEVPLFRQRCGKMNTVTIPPKALSFEGTDDITICIFFFSHPHRSEQRVNNLVMCPEAIQSFPVCAVRVQMTGVSIILTCFSNLLSEMSADLFCSHQAEQ